MSDITVTIVDADNVTVAVATETSNITVGADAVAVSVSDTAIPLDLYQPLITISATEPVNPNLNDLWLDIS
jgi:hypothetical protein